MFALPQCRMPLGRDIGRRQAYPGNRSLSRFWHRLEHFDTSSAVRLRSPPQITPDGIEAPPFPQRSPPRLLTTAAWGGLRSAPISRPRGTNPHLSYSTVTSF